ncbi:MAG TPA: hypothetical protein VI030_11385 [Propionibacteriaceae bacterium]
MEERPQETSSKLTVPVAVDAALGAAAMATNAAVWVVRRFARATAPVGRIVMHPPILAERLHPARVVEALADRGHVARTSTSADLNQIIAAVVPPVVYEVLDNLDLTALVLERVDIDTVVSAVDVEAIVDRVDIAAIVERLDIDAIVSNVDIDAIVRKVNIDAIASQLDIDSIVSRVDVDAIVSQLDIDAIVSRVDVDAIVSQLDVDAIVSQVDLDAIAKRIDLDAIAERIDIDAIVSRVDVDAIVRRLDLVGLAEEVVNGIDLPEIIRESTGSMASDVVRDVRMQSIDADVAIARLIDRILRRRRARRTDAPGEPESLTRANLPEPTAVAQRQPPLPQQPEPPKQELRR